MFLCEKVRESLRVVRNIEFDYVATITEFDF